MSDLLVQFQEWLAQYPTWMVAGGVGFAVVVVGILLWKAMRIMVTALIVAVLIAAGWYVWERVSSKPPAKVGSAPIVVDVGASREG